MLVIAVARRGGVTRRGELDEVYLPRLRDLFNGKGEPKRRSPIPEQGEIMDICPNLQDMLLNARKLVNKRSGQPESSNNGPEHVIARNRARLIAVCRLWSIVEWLIGDYCEKSLLLRDLAVEREKRKNAQKASEVESRDHHDKNNYSSIATGCEIKKCLLSYGEYGRLQRGFLLFELHRQIFGPVWNKDDDSAYLIGCLSYMEIAELRTMYDYLIEEVAKVADIKENFAHSCLVKEIQLRKKRK